MTDEEMIQALRQLARPKNAPRVARAFSDAFSATEKEQVVKVLIVVFTGFIIGDSQEKFLPSTQMAAWMFEAARAVANGNRTPETPSTPEMIATRLEVIANALRSIAAISKN